MRYKKGIQDQGIINIMFNRKRSKFILCSFSVFVSSKNYYPSIVGKPKLQNDPSQKIKKIKKVTIFTSNLLYLFYSDLFRKMIISSTYQFLQIQAPYSSYNKLGKDLATTNLVDQVSKLWLFHRRVQLLHRIFSLQPVLQHTQDH